MDKKSNIKLVFSMLVLLAILTGISYAVSITIPASSSTGTYGNSTTKYGSYIIKEGARLNFSITNGGSGNDNLTNVTFDITSNLTFVTGTNLTNLSKAAYNNIVFSGNTVTWNITNNSAFSAGSTYWFSFNVTPTTDAFANISINITAMNVSAGSTSTIVSRFWIDNRSPVINTTINSTTATATPYSPNYPEQTNISSFPVVFNITVNDTTNISKVWFIVSDPARTSNSTLVLMKDEGNGDYYSSTVTLNFSSPYFCPGPHTAYFCANDSAGNTACNTFGRGTATGGQGFNFVIKGANVTQIEEHMDTINGVSNTNISYENGTDFTAEMADASAYAYTMKMNLSGKYVTIVGFEINESLLRDMNGTNISVDPSTQVQNAIGSGYSSTMAWVNVSQWLPTGGLFKYGIFEVPGTGYDKVSRCNESLENPTCITLGKCNLSTINISNYLNVNMPCFLESGGFTVVYSRSFTGGVGGNDTTPPNVSFNYPYRDQNISTATPSITITLLDVNGTGIDSNLNDTINITVNATSGTSLYRVNVNTTQLSCTPSGSNETTVNCTLSSVTLPEGVNNITVVVVDASNNSNTNTSTIGFRVDATVPKVTLNSPLDGSWLRTNEGVFNYSAADSFLDACVLYGSFNGSWEKNETNMSANNGKVDLFNITLQNRTNVMWNVWCNDSAGGHAMNNTNFTIHVDSTDPEVAFNGTVPTEGSNSTVNNPWIHISFYDSARGLDNNSINVSVNATSGSGVTYYYLHHMTCVTAGVTNSFRSILINDTVNTTCSFRPVLPEGTIVINATAKDGLGNHQNASRVFTVDRTSPTVDWNSTSVTTTGTGGTIYIVANFSDPASGIKNVTLYKNGVLNQTNSSGINSVSDQFNFTYTASAVDQGSTLEFTVTAIDYVGQSNTTATMSVSISDGTAPVVTLVAPANHSNLTNANTSFQFTVTDNSDSSVTCNITVDSILNTTGITAATTGTTTAYLNLTGAGLLSEKAMSNPHNWSVSCWDSQSNVGNSSLRDFAVDTRAPSYDIFNASHQYNATHSKKINDSTNFSIAQDQDIYFYINWSDATSGIPNGDANKNATLEVYNTTDGLWYEVNETTYSAGWTNFTLNVTKGHNVYEGKNVTFRVTARDFAGNQNITNTTAVSLINRILVNDTTDPTVILRLWDSGKSRGGAVNWLNLTGNSIILNWTVLEESALTEINYSVDGWVENGTCAMFGNWTNATSPRNASDIKNWQVTIPSSGCSGLSNGTHGITFMARDSLGNNKTVTYNFTLDNEPPSVLLTRPANYSLGSPNMTSTGNITINLTKELISGVNRLQYYTNCNSTVTNFTNATAFAPFNRAGCKNSAAVRTLTINVSDLSGNVNTTEYTFNVDEVGPSIFTITSPTSGQVFSGEAEFNWSEINDDSRFMNISAFGYYLDNRDPLFLIGGAGNASTMNINNRTRLNISSGTHTVKFWANDTVGNTGNSSSISFTVEATYNVYGFVTNVTTENNVNISTFTLRLSDGTSLSGSGNTSIWTNQTFDIEIKTNSSRKGVNITIGIEDIDGSAANWANNFTVTSNHSAMRGQIEANWSTDVVNIVRFSDDLDNFLSSSTSYFGKIVIPHDVSNSSRVDNVWWFENESDATSKQDVNACSGAGSTTPYLVTSTIPCYNVTNTSHSGSSTIFIPHFSMVVVANDSTPPSVVVVRPSANANTLSTFAINITVSSDIDNASYRVNDTSSNSTDFVCSGTTCLSDVRSFINNTNSSTHANYTLYLYVWDTSGNLNNSETVDFYITDTSIPAVTGVQNKSITATAATITWNTTEYANATVQFWTAGSPGAITFAKDDTYDQKQQSVALSLTASTTYAYNVTSCDYAGNCNKTGPYNFSTTAAAAEDAAADSSVGGGGSAADWQSPAGEIVTTVSKMWASIEAGKTAQMSISKDTIAVTSIEMTASKEIILPSLYVSSLSKHPRSVKTEIPGSYLAYQYLQFSSIRLEDASLSSANTKFKVEKSWLSQKGISEGDIALFKYEAGSWDEMSTTKTSSDATYVYYEASVPGFSYFVIASKTGGGLTAFYIIDIIREFYEGTSDMTAFAIIDEIRSFYGG